MNSFSSTSPIPNKSPFRMKHSQLTWSILKPIVFVLATMTIAKGADSDFDGLDDAVETNTGIYVSPSNTGTTPGAADSDGDGIPDGLEVKEKTSPVDATKYNSFSKNLKIYLNFESGLNNTSGHIRAISKIGNPTLVSGIEGMGMRFDGLSDSLAFSNDSDLPLYRSDWGNPPASINQRPLSISI
jgi:hypothetical protein